MQMSALNFADFKHHLDQSIHMLTSSGEIVTTCCILVKHHVAFPTEIGRIFTPFTPATVDGEDGNDVLYRTYTNKLCDLDPIPTILVKACLESLVGPITNAMSTSLRFGTFPV